MATIFVSYSRKNTDFCKRLTAELEKRDLDCWVDWEGIPPTVDWMKEIEKSIEEADAFLAIVSTEWISSKVCREELDLAVKNGKRLIPVVPYEIVWNDVPPALAQLNFIFFTDKFDFDQQLQKLFTALDTDYEWVKTHRRLQVRALEWEHNRRENSFLLRGKDLQDAEFQLSVNASKDPHITDLQRAYLLRSRQMTDRQRWRVTAISMVAAVVMLLLAIFGFYQADQATQKARLARTGELAAQSITARAKQPILSYLLGIEAFRLTDNLRTRSGLLDNLNAHPQLRRYLIGHSNAVWSVAFSPDGKILASGSWDDTIILWDMATYQPIGQPLVGHTQDIYSLAFSPDGSLLASGGADGTILLWDMKVHPPRQYPLTEDLGGVQSLAFSPDGSLLASGSSRGRINFWDIRTGQRSGDPLIQPNTTIADPLFSVAFSPDGQTLASASCAQRGEASCLQGEIMLWDVITRQAIVQPLVAHAGLARSLAFSPDGKILASGGGDNTIILWDAEKYQPIGQPLIGHTGLVYSVAFSADSGTLASASSDGTVILWDVKTHRPVDLSFTGHAGAVFSVAFRPQDGAETLASGSFDHTVVLWDIKMRQPVGRQIAKGLEAARIVDAIFSPDGNTLTLHTEDGVTILWDLRTDKAIDGPVEAQAGFQAVSTEVEAISPDGQLTATASCGERDQKYVCRKGEVILQKAATGLPVGQPLSGHIREVSSLAFSPDGTILASGSNDRTIILWDVSTQQPLGQPLLILSDLTTVGRLAFSPDGKTLASGTGDGAVTLWDVPTHQRIGLPLTGQSTSIQVLAFRPDGMALLSTDFDNTIILWDLDPESWIGTTCQRVGRNFGMAEWEQYFQDESYRKTCEQWP